MASENDKTQPEPRMHRMIREGLRHDGRRSEEADELIREIMDGFRWSFARPRLEREPRRGDKSNPLNLIDEFVNRRWEEAKAALQPIKDRTESNPRQKALLNRLYSPTTPLTDGDIYDLYQQLLRRRPTLSRKWHHLLEVCYELTVQADIVETASDCLHPEIYRELPPERAGLLVLHNYRSWFVHGFALAERVQQAIEKTALLYTTDTAERNALFNLYRRRIAREVTGMIREHRTEFAHGTIRSQIGSAMTTDGLWEGFLEDRRTLADQIFGWDYPSQARIALSGHFNDHICFMSAALDHLGTILQDFEKSLLELRIIRALRAEIRTRARP